VRNQENSTVKSGTSVLIALTNPQFTADPFDKRPFSLTPWQAVGSNPWVKTGPTLETDKVTGRKADEIGFLRTALGINRRATALKCAMAIRRLMIVNAVFVASADGSDKGERANAVQITTRFDHSAVPKG
jgi:hypothetical protein